MNAGLSLVTNHNISSQAILDPKTSKRIFELAKDQQDELEEADEDEVLSDSSFSRARDLEEIDDDEAAEEYTGFLDVDQEEHELVRLLSLFDVRSHRCDCNSYAGHRRGRHKSLRYTIAA